MAVKNTAARAPVRVMEPASKLQLFLFLLSLSAIALFYTVLPGQEIAPHDAEIPNISQSLIPGYCRVSPRARANVGVCWSSYSVLAFLMDGCGRRIREIFPRPTAKSKLNEQKIKLGAARPGYTEAGLFKRHEKESQRKNDNLIYEILIVLLVILVTASIADCLQERKRRKVNSLENEGDSSTVRAGLCSRRMSLADLTISRHARKESQANFRPPAVGGRSLALGYRSCSHETPQNKNGLVFRQSSCPHTLLRRMSASIDITLEKHLEDGGWAERRRVRMIQRH